MGKELTAVLQQRKHRNMRYNIKELDRAQARDYEHSAAMRSIVCRFLRQRED
jgi:hypothetical protein